MLKRILVVVVALILTACSEAETPESVTPADQGGNLESALDTFQTLADQGDAGAQYNLGQMYRRDIAESW